MKGNQWAISGNCLPFKVSRFIQKSLGECCVWKLGILSFSKHRLINSSGCSLANQVGHIFEKNDISMKKEDYSKCFGGFFCVIFSLDVQCQKFHGLSSLWHNIQLKMNKRTYERVSGHKSIFANYYKWKPKNQCIQCIHKMSMCKLNNTISNRQNFYKEHFLLAQKLNEHELFSLNIKPTRTCLHLSPTSLFWNVVQWAFDERCIEHFKLDSTK